MLTGSTAEKDEALDMNKLKAVWSGEGGDDAGDEYAAAAVTGTMAIALRLMDRAGGIEDAHAAALEMWNTRDRNNPGIAA